MTDPAKNPPVGDPSNAGGEGGEGGEGGSGDKTETVAYDTHRKLLSEKKTLQAKHDELLREKQEREAKELEAKGEYQKLLEQERKAREDLEVKLKATSEQEKERRKLAAVLGAAGGTIEAKWYDLVANSVLNDVLVDPDSGEVDKMSVTKAVEKLKASYPEIIKGKAGPGLPNAHPGAGGQTPGMILRSEWMKLPSKEMLKWKPSQIADG